MVGNKSPHTRRGRYSGGISIYYKKHLEDKISIVEKDQNGIIWLKLCKSLFSFNEDVYICCCYIVPSDSNVLRHKNVNLIDDIEKGIEKYINQGKIFITGDLNCRTADKSDYISFDRYLDANNCLQSNIYTNRASKDHVFDTRGRKLIEFCKSTNFLIGNGRLRDDMNIGEFTFINSNGRSVVDYLLLKYDDFQYINKFVIMPPNEYSDHCPINIGITRKQIDIEPQCENNTQSEYINWNSERIDEFRGRLLDNINIINNLTAELSSCTVHTSIEQFTAFMQEHAFSIFRRYRKNNKTKKNNESKYWFNSECFKARKLFNVARNAYMRRKTTENKLCFLNKKRHYVRIKRKYKNKYMHEEGKQIGKLAKANQKSFWKKIRAKYQKKCGNPTNISIDDMLYTLIHCMDQLLQQIQIPM